ncbi:MAG: hypothetical protein K2X34_01490 [Hyphomonadaceae bacterium]|nr:hypothetical protein [Hyphomonadaceae bacterium]
MGNQAISGIAALVVLTFLALALAACSTTEQPTQFRADDHIAAPAGQPEFHGASIGADRLRSRLMSEA